MNTRSTIVHIVLIALLFSCCLSAICVGGGLYTFWRSPEIREIVEEIIVTPTPTPVPYVVRTPLVERTTEELLAKTEVPQRDLRELAARLKKIEEPIPVVVNETPPSYKLGDREVFWVGNVDTNEHFTVTCVLRYVTPHLYMWVEEGYEIEQEALERSAERFEEKTYPTNRRFFGSEWTPGVDNDVHLTILHVHGLGDFVSGYYSGSDEYSRLVHPYSNEREMFYVNLDEIEPGSDFYDSLLAHEFQHMIHWATDRNEDSWVNEGFSELAVYINGYEVGWASLAFSKRPDTQLTSWPDPKEAAPNYGASFLFMAYFLERFGEEATRNVAAHQENGEEGFEAILAEKGVDFDEVFADWLIANYLDDPDLEDGRYGYRELDVGPQSIDYTHSHYPARRSTTVHQYAADYIEILGEGDLAVEFEGSTSVKLVDNEPFSGIYQWWSNRGDDSNMTLTRSFDLSGLSQATLEVWLWYDIEEDWDYAYISVSSDGGRTWDTLKGKYTTDTNPSGNNFGNGFTGKSGGGEEPKWVFEEIDLTPYVGGEILLRFEYITDDAVNRQGFCVDDISIPELGYFHDVEEGEGGWEARGFIRTNNLLSQRFLVQLIEIGEEKRVRRMELDEAQRGRLVLKGLGEDVERAILVISGLTPYTTLLAGYEYSIERLE